MCRARNVFLFCVLLLFAAPMRVIGGATFLAMVTSANNGTPLFREQGRGRGGYLIRFFGIGGDGGGWLASNAWWSRYPVCVAGAPGDCFWVLADRRHGSELLELGPKCFHPVKKFAWTAACPPSNTFAWPSPAAIATEHDGTFWLWFASRSWTHLRLRIYSPHLRRQLGSYTLGRGKYLAYSWVLAGRQAVVFLNTVAPGAKGCHVLVINENGRARAIDLTSRVGWRPRYLASIGNFVSGAAPGRGGRTIKELVNFTILPGGKITDVHIVRIMTPRHPMASVTAYALLSRHTAVCALQGKHGPELDRISVDGGKVERGVAIPHKGISLCVLHGVVYLTSPLGIVRAYTPGLKLLGGFSPVDKFVGSMALAHGH